MSNAGFGENLKNIIKKSLKYNLFDAFSDWARDQMRELGILEIFDEYIYWVAGWNNFHWIFKTLWTYPVKGKENFPAYGPVIAISNHQSELDPWLVGTSVNRKIVWLSKKENFEIPIFKSIIKPFGTIPIRRGQSDQQAIEKVKAVLESGGCVGMFPEGTRSPDGRLAPRFRSGAARLCIELGVPYVPFAIMGAYKVLPKNKDWTHTKIGLPIEVRVGKPVYVDPDVELTYENAQLVAREMRRDVLRLQLGKEVKSRVIMREDLRRLKEDVPLEEEEETPFPVPSIGKKKEFLEVSFDPAVDYSIS